MIHPESPNDIDNPSNHPSTLFVKLLTILLISVLLIATIATGVL